MNRDLLYDKKTGWDRLDDIGRQRMEELAGDYRRFLDRGKTERDAVSALVEMAERKGFRPFARGMEVKPGDRYYQVNRHKAVTLMVIGQRSLAEGISLTGAHLDAPRVDIRTVPLYEDSEMAFFKTHYYGGIKKYQWTTIPLELRGVVYTCDKEGNTGKVDVHIGQDPADPVFVITDLLPHLAGEQMRKTMMAGIPGESLNILIGSEPDLTMKKEDGDRVKMQILQWLNRTYGIRRRTSCRPSCAPYRPSTPGRWALTARSSAATGMTTGCAPSRRPRRCSIWSRRRTRRPCACWSTGRRSAPTASPACSPSSLTRSSPTCAGRSRCCPNSAWKTAPASRPMWPTPTIPTTPTCPTPATTRA